MGYLCICKCWQLIRFSLKVLCGPKTHVQPEFGLRWESLKMEGSCSLELQGTLLVIFPCPALQACGEDQRWQSGLESIIYCKVQSTWKGLLSSWQPFPCYRKVPPHVAEISLALVLLLGPIEPAGSQLFPQKI